MFIRVHLWFLLFFLISSCLSGFFGSFALFFIIDFIIVYYDNIITMSLMSYLVTSETRRKLLRLLWVDHVEASGYQLAQLAGAAYSAVHAELQAMTKEGLVHSRTKGRARLFRKNDQYRQRNALTLLLGVPAARDSLPQPGESDIRLNLVKHGAPLAVQGATRLDLSLEETLVYSLRLARRDATVARVLPLVFARNKDNWHMARLEFLARKHEVLPVLGFFLDLTALLSKSRKLRTQARRLKDHRRKRMENFFVDRRFSKFELELNRRNTPTVARSWRFLLNMGVDSFQDLYDKHISEGSTSQ